MDHIIEWIIPDHVVRVKPIGVQTLETMAARSQEIYSLLENTSSQRVHFIYDNSELTQLPSDLKGMKKSLTWTHHPKVDWIVSYNGQVGAVMYVARVLSRFLNIKYSNQISYAHAMHFLMKKDPVLNNIGNFVAELSPA